MCVGLLGLVLWCEEPKKPVPVADSFCVVAREIRPSRRDRLTDGTVRQIVTHNLKVRRLCRTRKKTRRK
jgi:hypothetical protein